MWTGNKENSEYTAQITPYHNKVHAEIICREKNKDKGFNETTAGNNLWLTVMDKSFGKMFGNNPREKDWKDANDWVEKQLEMIKQYGTVMVIKPEHLRNQEGYGNFEKLH